MKLPVSVMKYTDDVHKRLRDVTVTFDATTTVGDVARVLVRGGAGHPQLMQFAVQRHAPLTLRVAYPDGKTLILDTGDAAASAGLMAGVEIEPVLETSPGVGERARTPIATVTVLDGPQQGVQFLAVNTETTVGRDRGTGSNSTTRGCRVAMRCCAGSGTRSRSRISAPRTAPLSSLRTGPSTRTTRSAPPAGRWSLSGR